MAQVLTQNIKLNAFVENTYSLQQHIFVNLPQISKTLDEIFPGKKQLEPDDFYWEGGYRVFTAKYLLKRGHCCKSHCRHCPYGFNDKKKKTNYEK